MHARIGGCSNAWGDMPAYFCQEICCQQHETCSNYCVMNCPDMPCTTAPAIPTT